QHVAASQCAPTRSALSEWSTAQRRVEEITKTILLLMKSLGPQRNSIINPVSIAGPTKATERTRSGADFNPARVFTLISTVSGSPVKKNVTSTSTVPIMKVGKVTIGQVLRTYSNGGPSVLESQSKNRMPVTAGWGHG